MSSLLSVTDPPDGWTFQRFDRLVKRVRDSGRTDLPFLSVFLDEGVVPRESRADNFNRLGADTSNYLVVRPGDIVFNKLRTWQGGVGMSKYEGRVSPAYFVCRPSSAVEPRFLHYLLRSTIYLQELTRISKWMPPAQFDIGWEQLRLLPTLLPGIGEQRAITDFLDRETARIDALITKKRNLRTLAEERFESAIYDAIRGITPSKREPRKPSGREWLGDIPKHWTMPPVGANFDVILGKMVNPEATAAAERFPYLRNTNVKWDSFDTSDVEEMGFSPSERIKYSLRKGDCLVCEGGEVGRAAIWDRDNEELYFQKAVHRVRPRREASTRFLMYCLRAAAKREVFRIEGNQATIVHLTAEKLRVHRFPWPPPVEQDQIVARLDGERDALHLLRSRLDTQLRLLQEHRQTLITAAVTGRMEIPLAA
jgi:type I restriction enzyme S subunit